MNIICAFSSDSRELYKADIYRVLALPRNHIVHFRYKKKYVDDNLINNPDSLKNQKVAIFFTHDNPIEPTTNNNSKNLSIRWGTITVAELSNETEVFHIYMSLGDFCNIQIDTGNSDEKRPPVKFLSKLACTEKNNENNWHSRILKIKDHFPKMTFFHLKSINEDHYENKIKNNKGGKSCHYNLVHGDRYTLRLAIANPDSSNTKIEISDSSEDITINCINPLESSVQFDDQEIPFTVKTLQDFKKASLLSFKPIKQNQNTDIQETLGEYAVNIDLNLNLGFKRPIIFGLFSTAIFWAILLAQPISNTSTTPPTWLLIISAILFFASSSVLFSWFNKK